MNINFSNLDNLMDFLTNTKEFNSWETVICRISASNGVELNINTHINDTYGVRQYTEFKKLKLMISNFYSQNEYLSVNMEVKLKFPDSLKKSLDPNDVYEAFYIDFFSDAISNFIAITFVEKAKTLDDLPVKSWIIYITNLYNTWEKSL